MDRAREEANYRSNNGGEAEVSQDVSAAGQAQQAVQGSGVQNVYLQGSDRDFEPVVSVVSPFGQRDEKLPVRGRDELLNELAANTVDTRIWVIHGLGGSGKTRLALEAAFRAEELGTEVWWVTAVDPDMLVAGMRAVGRRLGLGHEDLKHGDAADLVWQRLSDREDPWLLVVDGADDPQVLRARGVALRMGADGCGRWQVT